MLQLPNNNDNTVNQPHLLIIHIRTITMTLHERAMVVTGTMTARQIRFIQVYQLLLLILLFFNDNFLLVLLLLLLLEQQCIHHSFFLALFFFSTALCIFVLIFFCFHCFCCFAFFLNKFFFF